MKIRLDLTKIFFALIINTFLLSAQLANASPVKLSSNSTTGMVTPSNVTHTIFGNVESCTYSRFNPNLCDWDACWEVCDPYSCWVNCDTWYCDAGWCNYGGGGRGRCFPSNSLLNVQTKTENNELITHKKSFHDIRVGDMVESAPNAFSPILTFMHRDPKEKSVFLSIVTDKSSLTLSPGHFLFKLEEGMEAKTENAKFVKAKDIKLGDNILVPSGQDFETVKVTDINYKISTGIYAPITKEGTLVVYPDETATGIMASCYSDFSHTELTAYYADWKASIENSIGYTMDENTEYGTGTVSQTISDLVIRTEETQE